MHRNNRVSQQDLCLICHRPVLSIPSIAHFIFPIPICPACIQNFVRIDYVSYISNRPIRIPYDYNEFFKTILFRFKGQYDYELRKVFLCTMKDELECYKDYVVAVAPSDDESNKKRGFAPAASIAMTFSSSIFSGLYKTNRHKQAELTFSQRDKIKDVLDIKNGEFLRHKKVLLFDDVITSGHTIEKCIELIETYSPQIIEVLILASHSYPLNHPIEKVQKNT